MKDRRDFPIWVIIPLVAIALMVFMAGFLISWSFATGLGLLLVFSMVIVPILLWLMDDLVPKWAGALRRRLR